MAIDAVTIYVTVILGNLFTILLVGAYAYHHNDPQVKLYVIGKVLESLGFFVTLLPRDVMPLLLITVGNTSLIAGVACESLAMLRVAGFSARSLQSAYWIGAVLSIALFGTAAILGASSALRITLMSIICIAALAAPTTYFLATPKASAVVRVTGLMYLLVVFGLILRMIEAFRSDGTLEIQSSTLMQNATYLSFFLNQVVGTVGFLLLSKEGIDRKLEEAATTDPLTSLANRRHFNEVLDTEFSRLKRSGAPLSLILLDVDHFKLYNDHYGHVEGDECLRRVGRAIKAETKRAHDLAARYGGEEFVVVAPETDTAGARAQAEKIRKSIEALAIPHAGNSAGPHVTASLGVVTRYATEFETPEALIELADLALYRAKQAGRNRTEIMPRQQDKVSDDQGLVCLVWKPIYESGHKALDDEHKALVDLANQLLSAVVEGQTKPACRTLLDRLLATVVTHFKDEETLLGNTDFPLVEHHVQCHKELVVKALDMSDRFDRGEFSIDELFIFLTYEVIAQHLFREDKKFFPYLTGEFATLETKPA